MPAIYKGSSRFLQIETTTPGLKSRIKNTLNFHSDHFVWKIRFTAPLNASTVNNKNLYVLNESGLPLKTNIRYISSTNEIEIEPLEQYDSNQFYSLHISTKVRSRGGQTLKEPAELKFHI